LYAIAGVTFACFVLLFSLIRSADFFQISKISIEGAPEGEEEHLRRAAYATMMGRFTARALGSSHYFTWTDKMSLPRWEYEDVSIKKNILARTVTIRVVQREPFGIWCADGDGINATCSWFDKKEGIVMGASSAIEGAAILRIDETNGGGVGVGDVVLPPQEFEYMKKILEFFALERISRSRVAIEREHSELIFEDTTGKKFIFSMRFDPETNLMGLKKILSDSRDKTYSVDASVPGKLYRK
jgi:hypothetical protein